MDLNGPIQHFLGIKFQCNCDHDGEVNIFMGQETFVDTLVQDANLSDPSVSTPHTPYKAGCPVDKIPSYIPASSLNSYKQANLVQTM
mmetsp:Transcript_10476/g.14801  ORF Transcript_10476/g.14801 Transcript_10476/m.14801 type:complete len:87 (+) Transcript_10476:547-807(+)